MKYFSENKVSIDKNCYLKDVVTEKSSFINKSVL